MSRNVLNQTLAEHNKTLSEVLSYRNLLLSIIDEFESDLRNTYELEKVKQCSVQKLQQEHLQLIQSLEDVEEYICTYDAKTKTEKKLVTLTMLDIFSRLNNIDQSDRHIQALIDRINSL